MVAFSRRLNWPSALAHRRRDRQRLKRSSMNRRGRRGAIGGQLEPGTFPAKCARQWASCCSKTGPESHWRCRWPKSAYWIGSSARRAGWPESGGVELG